MSMTRSSQADCDTVVLPAPTSVRKASTIDIPWILIELKAFSQFYMPDTPMMDFGNVEHNVTFLQDMVENHVLLISEDHGQRTGLIGGIITYHMFNPNLRVMFETFWWVKEEYRGTRAGAILLREFIDYAKRDKQIDLLTMSLLDNSPLNDDVLLKRGFSIKERNYVMEV